VHGLKRVRHLREARGTAKPSGAAAAAEMRRSGRSARRRGSVAAVEVRRGSQGATVHELSNNRQGMAPYLLARILDGSRRRDSGDGGASMAAAS
jgi:hypothetical protein